MPDLRYHLISLISVFLALAIGILLGVAMADRGVVSGRVQAEITSIQQQFASQQKEIGKQNEQISEQQKMLGGMSEVVISGRLRGKNVALIRGPYADPGVSGEVQSDLNKAGAKITMVESLDAPDASEVTLPENTSPQSKTRLETDYVNFAREVLGYTGGGDDPPEIVIFVGGGAIPADAPPGTRYALENAQAAMLRVWLDAGVRVVGAEPLHAGRSEVQLFQDVGIPSVTDADEPAGRAAIVECAAKADCEGTYGTKDTATDPFPPPS